MRTHTQPNHNWVKIAMAGATERRMTSNLVIMWEYGQLEGTEKQTEDLPTRYLYTMQSFYFTQVIIIKVKYTE